MHKIIPKWIYDHELSTCQKAEKFSYKGLHFKAKVVDIYDGDTLTVVFRYNGKLQQHSCRMLGYDSPEMKPPKTQVNRDLEIAAAIKAKTALSNIILNRVIDIQCDQFDKYGRILITIMIRPPTSICCHYCTPKINLNKWMIDQGYGIPYTGGTKVAFDTITYPNLSQ